MTLFLLVHFLGLSLCSFRIQDQDKHPGFAIISQCLLLSLKAERGLHILVYCALLE